MSQARPLEMELRLPEGESPLSNCYQMCFGNWRNIKYQVAV